MLDVPAPDPTSPAEAENAYSFEKALPLPHGATGCIDLYRRGCFVLLTARGHDRAEPGGVFSQEAERQLAGPRLRPGGPRHRGLGQGHDRVHQQAQSYARNLPVEEVHEGRPPFLIVVDLGQSIALYAEFKGLLAC